jgi:hypothetical protein
MLTARLAGVHGLRVNSCAPTVAIPGLSVAIILSKTAMSSGLRESIYSNYTQNYQNLKSSDKTALRIFLYDT